VVSTGNVCKAKRKDGQPCGAYAVEGSDFCFWHTPGLEQERRESRARGGRARHGRVLSTGMDGDPVVLSSVGDVVGVLERALADVMTLEQSVARARAVGYLCNVAIRALEISELERRLDVLENKLGV